MNNHPATVDVAGVQQVKAAAQWRRNRALAGSMNRGPELLGSRVVGPHKFFRQLRLLGKSIKLLPPDEGF